MDTSVVVLLYYFEIDIAKKLLFPATREICQITKVARLILPDHVMFLQREDTIQEKKPANVASPKWLYALVRCKDVRLHRLARVKDIMTTNVPRVKASATVLEAAETMNRAMSTGVVVCEDDKVVGLLTTRRLLWDFFALNKKPEDVKVSQVMGPILSHRPKRLNKGSGQENTCK